MGLTSKNFWRGKETEKSRSVPVYNGVYNFGTEADFCMLKITVELE